MLAKINEINYAFIDIGISSVHFKMIKNVNHWFKYSESKFKSSVSNKKQSKVRVNYNIVSDVFHYITLWCIVVLH